MIGGFYLMHRGWQDNPMFPSPKREPFCHRAAWVWLIERACHTAQTVRYHGQDVKLERGQLIASLQDMGGAWGWNTTKVARGIQALQRAAAIVIVTVTVGTIITVCNYDDYQVSENATVIASESDRDTERRATVTGNKEENKPSPNGEGSTTRATRLPKDFEMPAEWVEDGASAREKAKLPPVDLATEAIKFTNHFLSKAGKDGAKVDWHRTWLNWCLNARGSANGRPASKPTAVDNLIEGFGRAAGLGRPPDSEPDWSAAGPLLDGKHARFDA